MMISWPHPDSWNFCALFLACFNANDHLKRFEECFFSLAERGRAKFISPPQKSKCCEFLNNSPREFWKDEECQAWLKEMAASGGLFPNVMMEERCSTQKVSQIWSILSMCALWSLVTKCRWLFCWPSSSLSFRDSSACVRIKHQSQMTTKGDIIIPRSSNLYI